MILQSKAVYIDEKFSARQIKIENGIITGIYPYGLFEVDEDYGDNWILPGLIDIHNHGYHGFDSNHATEDSVREWMKYLVSEAVTSTLPTVSSCSGESTMLNSMRNIANVINSGNEGCHILGIYSEGPFVSSTHNGAQDLTNQQIPTVEKIQEYQNACDGNLIYVMIAPEMIEDNTVINYCVNNGITVAIGHTGADFTCCKKAIDAGATSFTHTFNGMSPLKHREVGTTGAAMYFEDVYAEIIGDGYHVCNEAIKILASIKGKDRLITVTDSIAIKGYPVGEYDVGGLKVKVCPEKVVRLMDGSLCGSANTLINILRNEIVNANVDIVTAINSCTCNPANLLGFGNKKGYLKRNYDADICVIDKDFNVLATYVSGRKAYSNKK